MITTVLGGGCCTGCGHPKDDHEPQGDRPCRYRFDQSSGHGPCRCLAFSDASSAAPRTTPEGTAVVVEATPETTPQRVQRAPATRRRMPPLRVGATRKFRLRYRRDVVLETSDEVRNRVRSYLPEASGIGDDASIDRLIAACSGEDPLEDIRLYFTANEDETGAPGEVFVRADKAGTFTSGVLDMVATLISLLLQYGVPLDVILAKLRHTRFQPNGLTGDSGIRSCSSVLDLLAQWLEQRYQPKTEE